MKFKRIILISLILCVLSIACVSASDNQTSADNLQINDINANVINDEINEYTNDTNDIKGNTSDERSVVFDEVLSSSNSDDKLSAPKEGTRDELNNLIIAAKPGSTVTLDKDYSFESDVKSVEITKNIVIDGKGHTIYPGYNPVFDFKHNTPSGKIEIKNITFVRGIGSAIHFNEESCPFIISNCRFINCSSQIGGAIAGAAKYTSNIINCSFKGCHGMGESKVVRKETFNSASSSAFSNGGAIYMSGPVNVKSCRFEGCSAGNGGAIEAYGNFQIIDCVFVKNKAGRIDSFNSLEHGGAIRIHGGSGALIKGCTFNENHAGHYGGAISSYGNNVRIEDNVFNSNYIDNSIRREGGAIFVGRDSKIGDTPIQITRCVFNNNGYNNNNHYCKYGGAIYFSDGIISGTVSYCNFTGNGASKEGGAIYASSDCKFITFKGCAFTKNQVEKYGGAIYLDSKSSTIVDCAFVEQPNAIYCDNKGCSVKFSAFLNNGNYNVWSTKEINIANNWFGNTMDNRFYDFSKLKGKAVNLNNAENLYLVATSMDKNYHNGQESTVNLNFRYMRDEPTSYNKLPPFNNPAISYTVSGVNAAVTSKNNYLANGKSSFKFVADASKSSSSLTVNCHGAKLTLKFKIKPNSFTALQAAIDSCQNGVLNLTHNYTRDKSIDGDMTVTISKDLVINGNGFTLDSKNSGGVFFMSSRPNVDINNLNIVNSKSKWGSAIWGYINNMSVNNCRFINCSAKFEGGAINLVGKVLTITNSNFINNTADENGGSLIVTGINTVIRDCIFINSNSGMEGCFIYLQASSRLNLTDSILLTNSTSKYISKPEGESLRWNISANIENNWFSGTNDDILKNYDRINDFKVKSLLYLNVAPSLYDIPMGNTSKISLKFYSYDVNSRRSAALTSFRNMKFNVKLLKEGGRLSSNSIILNNNEGNVVYISSSNGIMPVEFNYELFSHRIYLNQYGDNSFTALQYLINNSGNVINLTKDYTFSNISDYKLFDGVYINKDLTINGNGHILSGSGQARIFNIGGHTVVLNNITFIKGKADDGGAIFASPTSSLSIDSCRFENNTAKNGGAIYLKYFKSIIMESSFFKNNSATATGGAIYYYGNYGNKELFDITGTFINNRAGVDGGAIYEHDIANYRLKGNFTNNTAGRNGGAVCSDSVFVIGTISIDGIFDSNAAAFGGAVYSFNPFGNFTGIYQNNRASQDGGAIYMVRSSVRYGMPNTISGEFYSNTAKGQGSAVCAMNLSDKDVDLHDSIFMKNSGKSTLYSSGYAYLNVHDSIFVENHDDKVLDTSKDYAVDGRLKAYNNWFGHTVDNFDKKPSVGERVILNDWLYVDVDYGKTETDLKSKNNIIFTLKSYDAKKEKVSDYTGNFKLNLSLKSDSGNFSTNSFILDNAPVKVTYVPNKYDENTVVVWANLSKYSHKTYEIKYNIVEHPSDSFYALQYEIDHMKGNVLNLTNNYEFYPESDTPNGIKINKSITINGNGFAIDGKGSSSIFNISADNVVLENISLINGNDINGSAIYAEGNNIIIRNSILLNNTDVVIYATKSLTANYNWWGNTADTFNKKANVSSNVILDNALFATFNAKSTVIGAGNNTTVVLNLTNLYNFSTKTNSTYDGLNLFTFDFNAEDGKVNKTSDKLNKGIINVSFEVIGPLYADIYAKYKNVVLNYTFEVVYDDDSFTALYALINKTAPNGILNLEHDYKFYYYDADYIEGIPIDKAITINGNGFNVNGTGESCVFVVSADNVFLRNINIYDSLDAIEWLGNNGLINNITVNNSNSSLNAFGSNLVIRNSNFTHASRYSLYLEGSNNVVDNCRFVDNSGPSIIGLSMNNLTIENSTFKNINSPISGIVEIIDCKDANISSCIFNNQNNQSIMILEGSTVYLNNNTLSKSDYIYNYGTILSKTYARMNKLNSSYMVDTEILLNATIYDDNNNIILVDEFYFKIGEKPAKAKLNNTAYEYKWTSTNGTWIVMPDINKTSFKNCEVDSATVNVLKYNSSVIITGIRDIIYGEDANIEFEFKNSTAVLVTVLLNSDVVFNETTNKTNIIIHDLKTGLYTVIISTLETGRYQSSNATSDLRVNRAGSSLTLEAIVDTYYGKDLIINFTVENRTVVTATIYDINTGKYVFNDIVEGNLLVLNNLTVGSYSITLNNLINPNYNPSGDYSTFNVLKVNSTINMDDETEYVYDNVTIKYNVDNLTDILVAVIDLESGDIYNFTTTNSSINLDLDAGSYQITLVNMETENVFSSEDSKTITVLPANTSVKIDDIDNVHYGEDVEIIFDVINATNVTVIVKNEKNVIIYQNNTNESYIYLSDLNVGKYSVEVYNSATNNFKPSNDTKTFNVLKAGSFIEIEYDNLTTYGIPFKLDYDVENETLLNIRIYDSKGNIVYDKNFDEISELPDDMSNLTEEAYLGYYFFIHRNLTVGKYTFELRNLDTSNVIGYLVNGSFEIIKTTSEIEVYVEDIVYGEDLEIHIGVINTTIVNIIIKDDKGSIVYNDNVTSSPVIIRNWIPGNYTVIVTNLDTENIIGNSSSQDFQVFKINSTIKLNDISDIYYEDNISISFDVENKTIVNIRIQNQDGEVVYDNNVTSDTIIVPNLDAGNYTVTVTNLETFNITKSSDSKSFRVLKRNINITVTVENNIYGEPTVINVYSDIDGTFPVIIGTQQVLVSVKNGYGKNTTKLDAGNYIAYVNYTNDNYNINMTNSSFIVSKADISLRIEVSDKVYTADVTGKVFASVDGEYSVVINGNTIPVTVKNGSGEFNLGILKTGNYTITVIYNGTDNYKANTNKTTFKVSKSETNFNIKTDANNITYGDSLKITQTLPGDATGTITYTYANGTIIKVIKVGESFVLSNLDAGSYVIYGYYSGDSNYKSARDSLTITVNKAMNNIIVSGENTVYPENSTIKVIADIDGEYTVIISANKIIVNVINGVGIGSISLDAGKYIANIKYTNKNYENNIKSIAFNVAKANITLSVEVLDKVYTEDVDGNVFASVDGDYIVVIGDTSKLVSVKNGIGEFNLGILKTGNYKISVIFNGNENYNSNFKTTSFKVTETGTNFNIIANNTHITYGEDVKITQKLPGDATGTITYIFANGTVINIIKVGESFVLSNLDAGSYVIYGYYSGDSNYKSARDSLTITVNKAINNIIVSSENTVYPEKSTIKVKADIDGEYTVIISGKKIIVNVINGIGTSSISLDAGKYIANIEYTNKNYENNIKSIAFNVAKADVVLSVEVLDKVYTEDVGGNVFASVDGEYNIIINGNTILVTVKNGIGEFNLGILKAGDYSISVIYYGNKNYNSNYNTTSFKVTETGTNFNIIANNTHITYGEDVKITQKLPGDATGTITYIFANGTVINIIKVGESFVLSNLDAGSYVIYGYYSGDSNYKSAKDSLTIVVNPKGKENATISIDAPKVTEGENVTITVNLPADATGSVIATVNGKTYVAPVEKGTAIITIPELDAGNYVIPVYYSGDDKYNSQSKNANVTVEEDKSDIISAPDVTKYFHGPERFIITVTDYKGNPLANKTVKLTINGVEYTRTTNEHGITSIAINLQSNHYDAIVTVDNKTIKSVIIVLPTVKGTDLVKVFRNATQYYATFLDSQGNYLREGSVVRFNINGVMYERIVSGDKGLAKLNINLEQGEYIITAMNLETGEMASNKITVIPRIIENNDLIKYYRNASQYTVKLIGDDGNPVGAGEEVTFNINGVFYTRTTNEFGIAKLNINLEPGQYIITAEYNGCKVSNLITVLPVLTAQDLSMKYHDGSKFFATLVDGQGKPYANQKIQYNINGVFYNRPTDNNGQSALNINLKPGEYIITSSYDECYISNKITISS